MFRVCCALLVVAFGVPCFAGEAPIKVKVCVSILPQAYFVERVGGSHVDITVLVKPGQSPHTYEPTPKEIAALSEAKAYFTIGVPFEAALVEKAKSALPGLLIVDTRKGITLRTVTDRETFPGGGAKPAKASDDHDKRGGEADPHIWLAPRLVKAQAATICEALKQIDPPNAADYDANLEAFQNDLDAVDKRIAKALAPLKGREFFVYHPAFGYFADAYGLKQTAVEIEGKEPGARQLAELIDHAKSENVKVIFVQPQFSTKGAQAVADAIGGAVIAIDDLSRDYLGNLENIGAQVEKALSRK